MPAGSQRTRITVDVDEELKRRLRLAAARRDETLKEYVQRAVKTALDEDLPASLSADEDPVLAAVWDNDADNVYDEL